SAGRIVARTGPGGRTAGRAECGCSAADDASRSRAGDFVGFRPDHRSRGTFRAEQASGELLGVESARALFGRTAAAGRDLETRQSHDALVAGRGGTHGGASGPRTATGLPAAEVAAWQWSGEGRDGQKVGGTNVLDAAQPGRVCAAGSHAKQPVGHPGEGVSHRWADWAPCLPEKVGEFEQRIMIGSKVTG